MSDFYEQKNKAFKEQIDSFFNDDGTLTSDGKKIYIPGDHLNSGIGADYDMDTGSPKPLLPQIAGGFTRGQINLFGVPTPMHKSVNSSKLNNEVDYEFRWERGVKSRFPLTKSQKKKMSPRRIKKETKKVLSFKLRGKHR